MNNKRWTMNLLFTVYRSSFIVLSPPPSPYLPNPLLMSPPLHPIPGRLQVDIDDRSEIESDHL
jgi:hypothetical protein